MLQLFLTFGKKDNASWRYCVVENDPGVRGHSKHLPAGTLIWLLADDEPKTKAERPLPEPMYIRRCGNMRMTAVTEDEAMQITGVNHPMAALDKLRELVHESR